MTVTASLPSPAPARRRSGRRLAGERRRAGYLFVSAYICLLLLFGVLPTAYALYLSVTKPGSKWAGFHNFVATGHDYRFLPAFEHIAVYLTVWLVVLVVFVLVLALLLHGGVKRTVPLFRFLFYIPGALAGSASVLVWLFMLDPPISPWHFAESALHLAGLPQVVEPSHLPLIFAMIAFWTGAGGWVVVMNGALNNISDEVVESAKVDGANPFQVALRVKLPLIRKWVVYMVILAFAAGPSCLWNPRW